MTALYLVQQNTRIRIRNRRVQVERDVEMGEAPDVLVSIPLGQVSQVTLFGNISLTTPAIDAFLERNCEVVFLSQNGEFRGRLVGSVTPHVPLRKAQYACMSDQEAALKLAKNFVSAKLTHQRVLLQRHNRDVHKEMVTSSIDHLERALQAVPHKMSLDSLRGLEGAATAAYFSAFRTFFSADWNFNDRNRRPPADPVNVLLSFGYTLLAQAMSSAIQAVGMDPYVGYLHEYAYNRPALALDLMEEFRPVIDGLVLWCCRGGSLLPDRDFSPGPPERPVLLGDDGKRRFLDAYEKRMDQTFTHPIRGLKYPLRQCLIEQARQLAGNLTNSNYEYKGMGFR